MHTQTNCNIYCFSTATLIRGRASGLFYTYIACLVTVTNVIRAVYKFEFRFVIKETCNKWGRVIFKKQLQAVEETHVFDRVYMSAHDYRGNGLYPRFQFNRNMLSKGLPPVPHTPSWQK
jgi:hypothetical protein